MDLDGIAVFVKVVQAGSFSAAARLLGIPNTTVSAKVARLEKRLGVTLIQRTTRKLHVTPAGRAYFERCVQGLGEIESAEAEITLSAEPRGLLRITAPGDVAHGLLPGFVARFLERYPRTQVELIIANRMVDLLAEGVHLAVRAGALRDSSLVARRFVAYRGGLWASAAYLKEHGTPNTPRDLEAHECIVFPKRSGQPTRLTDGRAHADVVLKTRLAVDDLETLRQFAVQGKGIGMLIDYLAREAGLVPVLPKWSWASGALSFVYPGQRFVPANVRAFIDTALQLKEGTS
ncbi:MAG TPA: LysR family transcriptional regulator [Burkholderiales bacterium]|nr:LysR family transcriptional regulator [Burkholderiales bacterium]